MKKIIGIIVFAFIANVAVGQISLFKELNSKNIYLNTMNSTSVFVVKDSTTIEVYDENFNLQRTISGLPIFIGVSCPSKNVFTTNGKYEFILICINNATNSYEYKLYNEDKQLLFNFGEYAPYNFVNGRLITYKNINNSSMYNVRVYSIQGTINVPANADVNTIQSMAYPNPASSTISIKYNVSAMQEMIIRDINGRVIDNILLDPSQEEVRLNVNSYAKGVYIYSYATSSGKFVIQ